MDFMVQGKTTETDARLDATPIQTIGDPSIISRFYAESRFAATIPIYPGLRQAPACMPGG